MSKNTGNTRFRKIDVDQYNEDLYQDDQQQDDGQGPNETEVQSLLQKYPFTAASLICTIPYQF